MRVVQSVVTPRGALEAVSLEAVVATVQAPLEPAERQSERQVIGALAAQNAPLTLRQIHLKTGVPPAEIQRIVAGLCALGSVRRWNTVIESFAASGFAVSGADFGASLVTTA